MSHGSVFSSFLASQFILLLPFSAVALYLAIHSQRVLTRLQIALYRLPGSRGPSRQHGCLAFPSRASCQRPRSLHVRVSRDQGLPHCCHLARTAARSSEDERNTTRNFPFVHSSCSDFGSLKEILTFLARQVCGQQSPIYVCLRKSLFLFHFLIILSLDAEFWVGYFFPL